MKKYRVIWRNVPIEITVEVEAEDEDTAADMAWEQASDHASSIDMNDRHGCQFEVNLDGIGADDVVMIT
jgi:hypothetical protein